MRRIEREESEFDLLKPNPECAMCDVVDDYVCFFCEDYQVQTSKDKLIGEGLIYLNKGKLCI